MHRWFTSLQSVTKFFSLYIFFFLIIPSQFYHSVPLFLLCKLLNNLTLKCFQVFFVEVRAVCALFAPVYQRPFVVDPSGCVLGVKQLQWDVPSWEVWWHTAPPTLLPGHFYVEACPLRKWQEGELHQIPSCSNAVTFTSLQNQVSFHLTPHGHMGNRLSSTVCQK